MLNVCDARGFRRRIYLERTSLLRGFFRKIDRCSKFCFPVLVRGIDNGFALRIVKGLIKQICDGDRKGVKEIEKSGESDNMGNGDLAFVLVRYTDRGHNREV